MVTPLTIQRRLKRSFDSQHIKWFQTLVKSSREHFYHFFSSLWGEIIWKTFPWMKFEIIGLFANTWTAHYKYLLPDCENLPFPIQIQLSKKQKSFSRFFIPFMESPSNFEHFQTNKIVIANVFPKLATVQGLDTPLTIQQRLKTFFNSQHVKWFQTLVKSSWDDFYHIFLALQGEMTWKISPWLKFEMIALFVNTWTADYKYPVLDCENLTFPIQIQLS